LHNLKIIILTIYYIVNSKHVLKISYILSIGHFLRVHYFEICYHRKKFRTSTHTVAKVSI